MQKSQGTTTVVAGTVITALLTVLTGMITWTFQDKVKVIDNNTNAINTLQVDNAVNQTDISYIKQGVDDLKTQNLEILNKLK